MGFIVLVIIVIIGIMIFKSSSETGTQESKASVSPQPSAPSLDINNPYDICRALACVATSIPYYKSDTGCFIHICIDKEKNETSINLSISDFALDRADISQYRRLYISDQIATFLSQVNFYDNGKGYWNIRFNRTIGERLAMEAIQSGVSMVNGRPYICNLKSYNIGNNPAKIAIDFDTSD